MGFRDALTYLFFPRSPAERARPLWQRRQDVRNNGRGPQAGEVEQWDLWDKTRPLHERGEGAFVPKEFVASDIERSRNNDGAKDYAQGGRSEKKTSSTHSNGFMGQARHSKKTVNPSSSRSTPPDENSHHRTTGAKAQSPTPTDSQIRGERTRTWSKARSVGASTVNIGHWQQSRGRWPFTGVRGGTKRRAYSWRE